LFSPRDCDMIDFGKFTVFQSLKEMIQEGDDISTFDFNLLAEKMKRNIINPDLLDSINGADEEPVVLSWQEDLK
jgi:hypothetical protein